MSKHGTSRMAEFSCAFLALLISLPMCCQSSSTAVQIPRVCQALPSGTPPDLVQALATQPTAKLYDQLGLLYGRAGSPKCASIAFQAALALDPTASETRYNLSLALIDNHQPAEAANQLRLVLQQQPDSFAAHNALGLALQDLGHNDDAVNEFRHALSINRQFALAYYDLAELLSSEHSYPAAIYYLTQGLTSSPGPQLALQIKTALAVAHAQNGNYAEAIPVLQDLAAAQPDSVELHYDLATAYAHQENYLESIKEYKEVLRLDPIHLSAELLLAKALLNQGNVEESLPYLRDYVQRNSDDPEGLEILGDALKDSIHPKEALEVLQHAVRANPNSYKAHYDLGVILGRSGRLEEGIRELQTAVKLKPDGSEARYQLSRLLARNKQDVAAKRQLAIFEKLKEDDERQTRAAFLANQANGALQQGRTKEAIETYRQAVALEPKDAKLHYNLAIAATKAGDHVAEEHELAKALELDPTFVQAHNQLGSSLLSSGKLVEAQREFRKALDFDPQSSDALNNLGTVLGHEGKNAEAEKLFRRAITLDPHEPLAYVNLGLTLAAQKKYSDAEQQLQNALALDANNANALTALGMLQDKAGRSADSVATFRKLAALHPESSAVHVNLGISLGDANDLNGALAEFTEAVRLDPNSALAEYNRGRVLYALHRPHDARESLDAAVKLSPMYVDALLLLGVIEHSSARSTQLFQRVVELQPDNSEAHFYLGRNRLQEGKKEEAIEQWKKAVELNPENTSALSSLARLLSQEKNPEAGEYLSRLQAVEQKQQQADRIKELNNFALHSAEQNNWMQAVAQLHEAIDLCRQCDQLGVLRKNIGLIYARAGKVEEARQELQRALKLLAAGPDMDAASEALRQLNPSGNSSPR
jgi:tetratricopeptide (TPR) repeat protein